MIINFRNYHAISGFLLVISSGCSQYDIQSYSTAYTIEQEIAETKRIVYAIKVNLFLKKSWRNDYDAVLTFSNQSDEDIKIYKDYVSHDFIRDGFLIFHN